MPNERSQSEKNTYECNYVIFWKNKIYGVREKLMTAKRSGDGWKNT